MLKDHYCKLIARQHGAWPKTNNQTANLPKLQTHNMIRNDYRLHMNNHVTPSTKQSKCHTGWTKT